MDLFIDKENVISFMNSRANVMYEDCVKLMKKQLDVKFNFKKDELKKDPELMMWYVSNFTQGVEDSEIDFDSSFPVKPLKSNSAIYFNSSELSSVYLLDDESVPKFKEAGSVIVGGVGEEVEILHSLFFRQNDYLFQKRWLFNGEKYRLANWEVLKCDTLPLTDIIIADAYILKQKDGEDSTLDNNLIKYLEVLVSRCQGKVNVVLITNPGNMEYPYEIVKEKVKQKIQLITGKKAFFTLVQTVKEHDRNVITNYKYITSGDTFNFWNGQGVKVSRGKGITYSSLAERNNYSDTNSILRDFQEIVCYLEQNNPEAIQGDKKSNFLNFN